VQEIIKGVLRAKLTDVKYSGELGKEIADAVKMEVRGARLPDRGRNRGCRSFQHTVAEPCYRCRKPAARPNYAWPAADLGLPRYKVMVHATVAENKGEGVRVGTRCMWDAVTDNMASETFHNVRFPRWPACAGEASHRQRGLAVHPFTTHCAGVLPPLCSWPLPFALVSFPRCAGQPRSGVHRIWHLPVLSAATFAAAACPDYAHS
jgi:hypothetical protein